MNDITKERLMLFIITMSCFGCVVESVFGKWEFWVPPLLFLGIAVLWWLHFAQKLTQRVRCDLYFVYAALLTFYHGVHGDSFFDIAIICMLLMVTFAVLDLDRTALLHLVLVEYAVLTVIQLFILHPGEGVLKDPVSIMRLVLHSGTFFCMYFLCRIAVGSRIASNARVEEWKQAVRENDHDMEDFLSNISHELRTPVNVVNGMTTLMQKDSDRQELSAVRDAGIRLSHQIEDIQDFTEIKRGELIPEEENYMCVSLVNDVVSYFKASDKSRDLELIVDLAPETPTMLKGDIRKLHKIFRHLLDNAMKFTRRGGVYIRVFSEPQKYGVNLTIEVTDTGIGMTRAAIAQVSKGLYQANKKRNRSTGGIGIGLPIVYGMVHQMNGFVNIKSARGKGTTVHISIPQQVVDPSCCLSVKDQIKSEIVFYTKPEKYLIPELRDFNKAMAVHLALGLKKHLYSAGTKRELEHLRDDLSVGYIFTGQEEYEAEAGMFDYLAGEGIRVIVYANRKLSVEPAAGVLVIPKPLYGFPVVRILNGETKDFACTNEQKPIFEGIRALIVDDEPMNLVVASGLLRDYRMIPDTAESGKEAIEKYTSGDYDIIFMDHMMPEMDGVEAMKRIRQIAMESQRTPVIVALTANALSGAREMFLKEGFDGFIAKPIDISDFERVMRHVLPDESEERGGL
ncbi:MAG: response regulator [Lachnospiraceae bacterium]|nr:response regulator [Lachnospiraceae bacterium]